MAVGGTANERDHAGTGSSDRVANMRAFSLRALELLAQTLESAD